MLVLTKALAIIALITSMVSAQQACIINDIDVPCRADSDCPSAGDICCVLAVGLVMIERQVLILNVGYASFTKHQL